MTNQWEYGRRRPRPSRRGFLKATLLMGLSSAAGITTSWLVLKDDNALVAQMQPLSPTAEPSPYTPPPTLPPVTAGGEVDTSELWAQIELLRNENLRLQTELTGAQSTVGSKDTELSTYQSHVTDLTAQVQASQGRLYILNGLLALYQHLDTLELDDLVELGAAEATTLLQKVLAQAPLVRSGAVAAAAVLDQLELSLPTIQDGLLWLRGLIGRVANALQSMEDALAQVVEPFQPVMQKLSAFSAKILDWIPFGWGDNIELGLNGIMGVLTHAPELVRATGPAVLEPLGDWFDGGQSVAKIQSSLIDVVRGQTVQSGAQLAADVEQLDLDFKANVVSPFQDRLDARRPVREQIARYKEQYGL